jgi:uncharacterized protein (TIGR02231 family)
MTKKIYQYVTLVTILCLSINPKSNANMTTDKKDKPESSTITAVTVFLDRAMVTRTITKKLTKGEHVLIFDNLPEAIEENSIQANGEGNAVLKDVKFKKEFYATITDDEKRGLNEKVLILQDSLVDANDHIANATKEQKMVEIMLDKMMTSIALVPSNEKEHTEVNPDKWTKMISYYRKKLDDLNKEIRTTERKIRNYNEEIRMVQAQINSLGGYQEKSKNIVEVLIDVTKEESDVLVNLVYMVHGPGWYPVYDLRVFTDTKKMHITYQAMIRQNTTEDWNNVKIKLSTARANMSGQQPSLSPWYLNFYEYARDDEYKSRAKKSSMSQMHNAMPSSKEIASADRAEEEAPAPILAMEQATVEAGATAAVFVVPGKNTIRSDNQQHKVTMMMNEFDAVFRYSTVPKLAQYAYLKAKVKNTTDFPLLAGSTNVFLDNNFVSTSNLDMVSPDQEFWTFLGIDEGIEVKYKTMKQYQKDEGVINKKNKYVYDYLIEITNNKKTEEEIVVWDQIPIASNPDIKVSLTEPDIQANKDTIKMDDANYIEWFYKIKPKEKVKIPFKFTVESPKNKNLSGL